MADTRPPKRYMKAALSVLTEAVSDRMFVIELQQQADGAAWRGFHDGYMGRPKTPEVIEECSQDLCDRLGVEMPDSHEEQMALCRQSYETDYKHGRATRAVMDGVVNGLRVLVELEDLPTTREDLLALVGQLHDEAHELPPAH